MNFSRLNTSRLDQDIYSMFDILDELEEAGCSEQDIQKLIGLLLDLIRGLRTTISYRCSNGEMVFIKKNRFGDLVIE